MENEQYKDFWRFIGLLNDNCLLEYVIVVGSWAEYLYAQSGILPGFTSNLRTLDVDFLIPNKHRPFEPVSIASIAREAGYTIDNDVLEGTTKIYTPDLMEIEFLIEQKGGGSESTIKTNLGVKAQALRHLSILSHHTKAIELFGLVIIAPSPEAYVIHKIIINKNRGIKAEKDKQAVMALMPYLNKDSFSDIYKGLTKKELQSVNEFLEASSPGFLS